VIRSGVAVRTSDIDNRDLSAQVEYLEARVAALRAECSRLERENLAMLGQLGQLGQSSEAMAGIIDRLERENHRLREPVDMV